MRFRSLLGRGWGFGPQALALLLVVGLVSAMAIQPTRQLLMQREKIDAAVGDLETLNRVNKKLQRRIERLQDPDFVEQLAREQTGLVRPGEIPYLVMPPSRQAQEQEERKRERKLAAKAPPPPEPGLIEGFLDFVGF